VGNPPSSASQGAASSCLGNRSIHLGAFRFAKNVLSVLSGAESHWEEMLTVWGKELEDRHPLLIGAFSAVKRLRSKLVRTSAGSTVRAVC